MRSFNAIRWSSLLRASTALTCTVALLALAAPTTARAQMPVPPNPPPPYAVEQQGTNGADGPAGPNDGQNGTSPASDINLLFPGNFTTVGKFAPPAVQITNAGGNGGNGGSSADQYTADGGDGGTGANSGNVVATFDQSTSTESGLITISNGGGPGLVISTQAGNGGSGGAAGEYGHAGVSGAGGTAGDITVNFIAPPSDGARAVISGGGNGAPGISLLSSGGNAGDAGVGSRSHISSVTGPNAANGGNAGDINATINAYVLNGINAMSLGGNGGAGGQAISDVGSATGGNGGLGGNGGAVTLNLTGGTVSNTGAATYGTGPTAQFNSFLNPNQTVPVATSVISAAISAVSEGGLGGAGGDASGFASSHAGTGGAAGAGGDVSVSFASTNIYTYGYGAPGIATLSIGGAGGDGAEASSLFSSSGGSGAPGGNAGIVSFNIGQTGTTWQQISTTGSASDGVIGMSVGGGGGYGGDVSGGGIGFSATLGGHGANGGDGGQVVVSNGYWDVPQDGSAPFFVNGDVISTTGDSSRGIAAESVGGGGGRGGSAFSAAVGLVSLAIGGVGGQGGDGGPVSAQNFGIIQTSGESSVGIDAMSVGGGGGDGGAAMALAGNLQFTASAAVGGNGGTGGVGGAVSAYNFHQVLTFGAQAYGIRAQSIGGGGGDGGASVALALQSVATDAIPSIALAVSLGGTGGTGGVANQVQVVNTGLLGTSGEGSIGMLAQSIGGGGGTGGDASALQTAYNAASINVDVAIGGNGAKGGNAGAVMAYNSGLLYTLGFMAPGIQAQSVGGGGGNGGFGVINSGAYNAASGPSVTSTVAIGGYGGAGGDGGAVSVYNYTNPTILPMYAVGLPDNITQNIYGAGGILTSGDDSPGIVAQSVGGGGGSGGTAMAAGSGGNITVNVAVGGYGGAGGNGGAVTVDNGPGAILTQGANSHGIFAYSVGGGGGSGGGAGTGSGADPQYALAEYVGNNMAQALGKDPNQTVENVFNNIWDWKDNVVSEYQYVSRLKDITDGYQVQNGPLVVPAESKISASDITVDIGGGWGGKGGAAGNGGTVTVNSAGQIETDGPMSSGIFAQSVGGGGGDGGAANPSTGNDQLASTTVSGSIAVGGTGGSNGDGGTVTVSNSGLINTYGDLSFGMFAQSIGGGGGVGGATAATTGLGSLLKVSIGGGDGSSGVGGAVTISNAGALNTVGELAYAVLAQSIGGGGGLATVMGAGYAEATGGSNSLLSGPTAPTQAAFAVGDGIGSVGGAVTINATGGSIQTSGVNASAIVAQSIGGGGGIIAVDNTQGITQNNVFSHIGRTGDGGTVTISTGTGANISTGGDGATAIVAQSLSGGGMIGGMDYLSPAVPVQTVPTISMGTGGAVNVTLNSMIQTTGLYAGGIFAQSAGLGGVVGGSTNGSSGGFAFAGEPLLPTCGCTNGSVQVTLNSGSEILVSGAGSYGVGMLANSNNGGANTTTLVVNGGIIIATGLSNGAVFVGGDFGNTVTIENGAVVDASKSNEGIAIAAWGLNGYRTYKGTVTIDHSTVGGSIELGDGSTVNNGVGSTFNSGAQVNLGPTGTLTNNGTINVGGAGKIASTVVTGSFIQGAAGVLQVDANQATGQADQINVQGSAQVGGTVQLVASNLMNKPVTVLTATGGVTTDPSLQSAPTYAFSYNTSVIGNSLQVQPVANLAGAANGLGSTSQQLASYLQQIWNSGGSLNGGFSALAGITDPHGFGSALNSVAGAAVRGVAATRQTASDRFFDNMVSCETLKPGASPFQEENCGWLRVVGGQTSLASMDGDPGYHQLASTSQVGGQFEFLPGWFVGGSLGFEQSWLSGDGASVSGQTGLAGLMIKHQTGPWLLSADLDGGFGSYQSTRTISVGSQTGTANGAPDLFHIGGHVRAAYQVPLAAATYLEPSLTLGVLDTHLTGYGETGSTSFNLNVRGSNNVTVSASPMVEFGAIRGIDTTHSFRVFADAGMGAYSNSDWGGEANLELAPAGTGSFTVDSKLPSVVGKFKAGVDIQAGGGMHVKFVYSADIASGFLSQVVVGRLSYAF